MRASAVAVDLPGKLADWSDSVELKFALPENEGRRTLTGLGIDLLGAQRRKVFYLDTGNLALNAAGVIVRVRQTRHAKDDAVIKLRPAVPGELDEETRHRKGFKVEVDVTPASFACSASLKAQPPAGTVADAVAGRAPASAMFTPEQRGFFAAHAPAGMVLDDLRILGPVAVLKRTLTPPGLAHPLTVELWTFPAGPGLLELSTRVPPGEAPQAMAQWRAFLTSHHVPTGGYAWTKTQAALAVLPRQARRRPPRPPGARR